MSSKNVSISLLKITCDCKRVCTREQSFSQCLSSQGKDYQTRVGHTVDLTGLPLARSFFRSAICDSLSSNGLFSHGRNVATLGRKLSAKVFCCLPLTRGCGRTRNGRSSRQLQPLSRSCVHRLPTAPRRTASTQPLAAHRAAASPLLARAPARPPPHPALRRAPRLHEVLKVHRHLVDLRRVVLLDVAQDADVVLLDKVDGHTLAPVAPRAADAVDVVLAVVREVVVDDE